MLKPYVHALYDWVRSYLCPRNNEITKPSRIRVIRVRNKAMVSTRAQAYIVSPVLETWADGMQYQQVEYRT